MNREKPIFHQEKYNFQPIGSSVHTTEYLAFGKGLLARLYLKVKCICECIFENSSELKNLPLLNIELTLILQFCFLDDLLKLCFLLDASIFTTIYEKKEEQKSTLQIFLKDVTEEKNVEIHKHS